MKKKPLFDHDFLNLRTVLNPFKVRAKQVGLPPGALIHVGERKTEQPVLDRIEYDATDYEVRKNLTVDQARARHESNRISWLNLTGIHDISLVSELGEAFGVHLLALEDILNTQHRPKIEAYDGCLLVILKMLHFEEKTKTIETEQVSLVVGPNFVLSFQENAEDVFDGVRDRLKRSSGRIRQRGSDYLAYALIDSIVDSYFHILEKVGDCLTDIEEELLTNPEQSTLGLVHHFKRELLLLHKSVWPLREVVSELQKGEIELVDETTLVFLRDLYDHTIQVMDTVQLFRETASGLQDLYLSSVSNRMNEIMKVLTIMASIFIPVTFIAGIYGMNFEYMPELKWRWGYFMVWGVILGCVGGMLVYFRKNKWL